MLLRIPAKNVADVRAREWVGAIAFAIRLGEGSKMRAPLRPLVQVKGVVDGVSRLVAEISHSLAVVFDAAGHLGFDPLEATIGQIERDADERRPIRTAPLVAEV